MGEGNPGGGLGRSKSTLATDGRSCSDGGGIHQTAEGSTILVISEEAV